MSQASFASVERRSEYLASVEWLRLLACLAIVAFHVGVFHDDIPLAGLPVFTALTVAFAARSARDRSWSSFVAARARTLVIPWLFWSASYGILKVAVAALHHQPLFGWVVWSTWLIGPSIHLWFLPFAFVATVLSGAWSQRSAGNGNWPPWLAAAIIASIVTCLLEDAGFSPPFGQWLSVLPAVAIGGCISQIPSAERAGKSALIIVGSSMIVTLSVLALIGYQVAAIPLLVGLGATVLAWGIRGTAGPRVIGWSRLSYGVYLIHPFFYFVLIAWTAANSLVTWMLVSIASLATVAIGRRTPLRIFM